MKIAKMVLCSVLYVLLAAALYPGSGVQDLNGAAQLPVRNITQGTGFLQIGEALAQAARGDEIVVSPGLYPGGVTVDKDVVLRSIDPCDPDVTAQTVVEGAKDRPVIAVTGTGRACVLAGLTFRSGTCGIECTRADPSIEGCAITSNTGDGILCLNNSAPAVHHCIIAVNGGAGLHRDGGRGRPMEVTNCTVAQNSEAGIRADFTTVANSIVWLNGSDPNAPQVSGRSTEVSYSCIQGGLSGLGNVEADPRFVSLGHWADSGENVARPVWVEGDYHLLSQGGRWDPNSGRWVKDGVTSPCIDKGSPASGVGQEPQPHGGRINLGAYGGTGQASKTLAQPGELCYQLDFSTYLGGRGYDDGHFQAVDREGYVYLTGNTASPDFPTTPGAYDTTLSPVSGEFLTDLFVAKMTPDGQGLVYSTFIGGRDYDGHDYFMTVDDAGRVCLAGQTASGDYPVTSDAYDRAYNGGELDVVVTVVDASGAKLDYSTFLGGSMSESPAGIQVDKQGNIYVYGVTDSSNFPRTAGAYDTTFHGARTTFLTKLNPAQGRLEYSTFLPGGVGMDSQIRLDGSGNCYVCTSQAGPGLPTTPGAAFPAFQGGETDVYIAKVNATGTGLVFATYLGGSAKEEVGSVTLDQDGNLVIAGLTQSADFPTTDDTGRLAKAGSSYLFVAVVDPSGSRLLSSSLVQELTGTVWDIAIDPSGTLIAISMETDVASLPTTACALDATYNREYDVYLAVYRYPALQRLYATYIGGNAGDFAFCVDFDQAGDLRLSGNTFSTDFPMKNAYQSVYKGGYKDGFVMKLKRMPLE